MKLILASCCGPKLDRALPAKDIYISDLFKKSRAYAEEHGDNWAILSALHGLVMPAQVIEPYDLTLVGMEKAKVQEWDALVAGQLRDLDSIPTSIEVLAGKSYLGWIPDFPQIDVQLPLEGMGIGQRLKFLKGAVTYSEERFELTFN